LGFNTKRGINKLMQKDQCDKLVVLTAKIIDKNLKPLVEIISQKPVKSNIISTTTKKLG
jgi:hypothetical protein